MPTIELLSQETIDKIAAGEVVERPSSVVKELVENAIDAGATAITVEIKDGGTSFIRVTDNGCGIPKDQIQLAFLRHSTSKIRSVEDLLSVSSLGFRGEALSSISAVAQVELITRVSSDFTGTRYLIEGSKEISMEEVGAPEGTTFLVRNLFYNTPARKKFLKSNQTEAGYINDLMQRMILSHPDVAFKFILQGQIKAQSSGNHQMKDIIYNIYGRDVAKDVILVEAECEYFKVHGYIGKPQISRGKRSYETFFMNGRYIKSGILASAIEEAYKPFVMQHQYPFCVLYFEMDSSKLDVNVHPTKMELRFENQQEVYAKLREIISDSLTHREFIPTVPVVEEKKVERAESVIPNPEPFEKHRFDELKSKISSSIAKDSPYRPQYTYRESITKDTLSVNETSILEEPSSSTDDMTTPDIKQPQVLPREVVEKEPVSYEQTSFLDKKSVKQHRIIGEVFQTFWLVEFDEKLYIIDQHAAHEKVLFEGMMRQLARKEYLSQQISPPIIFTVSLLEEQVLKKYWDQFHRLGYEISHFGGNEYSISALPSNLYRLNTRELFVQMLDELTDMGDTSTPDMILERVASMSCKAAVKAHDKLSLPEAEELIRQLLELENPYHCPHGRPTIIAMTKYELEKKFKRIV